MHCRIRSIRVELYFDFDGNFRLGLVVSEPGSERSSTNLLYKYDESSPRKPIGFDDSFYRNPYQNFIANFGFLYLKKMNILPEIRKIINAYIMILFIREKQWKIFTNCLIASFDLNEKWFFEDVYKIVQK